MNTPAPADPVSFGQRPDGKIPELCAVMPASKLCRRNFFELVDLTSDGFLIDAELFARARRHDLRWLQAPVRHRPRRQGASTVSAGSGVETLRGLVKPRRTLG